MTPEIAYTPESDEQVTSAPAFTYLMDTSGITYYSTGANTHPFANTIRTTAVYFPDPYGNRISLLTGQAYSKHIVHGYVSEDQVAAIPNRAQNHNNLIFDHDPVTQEKILGVDTSRVAYMFDPHCALQSVLEGNNYYIDVVRRRVDTIVTLMLNAGIPYEDLGLYGSLQVGLVPQDPSELRRFNDVDLVVTGTEHYDKVVQLAATYHDGANDWKKTAVRFQHNLAARKRRQQLSKLHLYDGEGEFFSDVKVVPAPGQIPSVTDLGVLQDGVNILFEYTVIEAYESLGYPAIWTVANADGHQLQIYSRMYDNIGAAGVGDMITAVGRMNHRGDLLVLTDNEHHHIYPT